MTVAVLLVIIGVVLLGLLVTMPVTAARRYRAATWLLRRDITTAVTQLSTMWRRRR